MLLSSEFLEMYTSPGFDDGLAFAVTNGKGTQSIYNSINREAVPVL